MKKMLNLSFFVFSFFIYAKGQNIDNAIYLSNPNGKLELKLNKIYEKYTFDSNPIILFEDVKFVKIINTQFDIPALLIQLNKKGSEDLKRITHLNKGKNLGLVFEGKLIAAPLINDEILDGEFAISGDITIEELKKIEKYIQKKMKH